MLTRPNDFSNPQEYAIQCSIIEAYSKIRDSKGHAPKKVKEFLLDKLKYNDNSNNDFSDAYYVATVMNALTQALIARSTRSISSEDVQFEELAELRQQEAFERECIEEIDRYRRMDEWASSYQNMYSRTALQCQAQLAKAGVVSFSLLHFMQYTRPGNYDALRHDAYAILIQPNILEDPYMAILGYATNSMVVSSSPYIRQGIQKAFGTVLAKRAVGMKRNSIQPEPEGLVVEEANAEAEAAQREHEVARKQNVDVAQAALMTELGEHVQLQQALWKAITYPQITLEDLSTLLDFARMLYRPVNEAKLQLSLPRFWRMQYLGKVCCIVSFRCPRDFSDIGLGQAEVHQRWPRPQRANEKMAATQASCTGPSTVAIETERS
jgi:transcription initiation factor TFIID subunit 2